MGSLEQGCTAIDALRSRGFPSLGRGDKSDEIWAWLAAHDWSRHVMLDDEQPGEGLAWIECDPAEGFTAASYRAALHQLGGINPARRISVETCGTAFMRHGRSRASLPEGLLS
ncbi:hypothetical protein [Acidisphaera sp. S103]|uniref:hypothetical protein n=1 Tax=Acidisphaera sp. S103 TaxID=1747223 RepID=UPI00131AD2E9|nr:hypothetical protein [Acidisphaera sp. S103]